MAGYFELKRSGSDKFAFNLKAGNHEIILTSQGYASKAGARDGIESVRKHAADESYYERKTASNGAPYFVLKASNGQVIGTSEMYSSSSSMEGGIQSVKTNAPTAVVKDTTV